MRAGYLGWVTLPRRVGCAVAYKIFLCVSGSAWRVKWWVGAMAPGIKARKIGDPIDKIIERASLDDIRRRELSSPR